MRKLIGLAIAAGLAMPAAANEWTNTDVFKLGNLLLGGQQGEIFTLILPDNAKGVIGFSVEFDYFEPIPDGSWASDAQVIVTSPLGAVYTVGGFDNAGAADELWVYDGPGSDGPGHYADQFFPWKDDLQPKGAWTVSFFNDWGADGNVNEYNNIVVTFYKIPGPGALALLGVAGLIARRRRR